MQLDRLITDLLRSAQALGFGPEDVRSRIEGRLRSHAAKRVLVIESDEKLRDIIAHEIGTATGGDVLGIDLGQFAGKYKNERAVYAAMMDEKPKIEGMIPPEKSCLYLRAHSVAEAMAGQPRPSQDDLIAVASGWEKFLLMAKTMLVAANLSRPA